MSFDFFSPTSNVYFCNINRIKFGKTNTTLYFSMRNTSKKSFLIRIQVKIKKKTSENKRVRFSAKTRTVPSLSERQWDVHRDGGGVTCRIQQQQQQWSRCRFRRIPHSSSPSSSRVWIKKKKKLK